MAYSNLVSAQGPLVLGLGLWGLGLWGLGPGLDNTKEILYAAHISRILLSESNYQGSIQA